MFPSLEGEDDLEFVFPPVGVVPFDSKKGLLLTGKVEFEISHELWIWNPGIRLACLFRLDDFMFGQAADVQKWYCYQVVTDLEKSDLTNGEVIRFGPGQAVSGDWLLVTKGLPRNPGPDRRLVVRPLGAGFAFPCRPDRNGVFNDLVSWGWTEDGRVLLNRSPRGGLALEIGEGEAGPEDPDQGIKMEVMRSAAIGRPTAASVRLFRRLMKMRDKIGFPDPVERWKESEPFLCFGSEIGCPTRLFTGRGCVTYQGPTCELPIVDYPDVGEDLLFDFSLGDLGEEKVLGVFRVLNIETGINLRRWELSLELLLPVSSSAYYRVRSFVDRLRKSSSGEILPPRWGSPPYFRPVTVPLFESMGSPNLVQVGVGPEGESLVAVTGRDGKTTVKRVSGDPVRVVEMGEEDPMPPVQAPFLATESDREPILLMSEDLELDQQRVKEALRRDAEFGRITQVMGRFVYAAYNTRTGRITFPSSWLQLPSSPSQDVPLIRTYDGEMDEFEPFWDWIGDTTYKVPELPPRIGAIVEVGVMTKTRKYVVFLGLQRRDPPTSAAFSAIEETWMFDVWQIRRVTKSEYAEVFGLVPAVSTPSLVETFLGEPYDREQEPLVEEQDTKLQTSVKQSKALVGVETIRGRKRLPDNAGAVRLALSRSGTTVDEESGEEEQDEGRPPAAKKRRFNWD